MSDNVLGLLSLPTYLPTNSVVSDGAAWRPRRDGRIDSLAQWCCIVPSGVSTDTFQDRHQGLDADRLRFNHAAQIVSADT